MGTSPTPQGFRAASVGWEVTRAGGTCWAGGASKASSRLGRNLSLHQDRCWGFSPPLIHQDVSGKIFKANIPVFLERKKKKKEKRSYF